MIFFKVVSVKELHVDSLAIPYSKIENMNIKQSIYSSKLIFRVFFL